MNTWTIEELAKINGSDKLQLSTVKKYGTLRNPLTIWVVLVNKDLFIPSVKGLSEKSYKHATDLHQGHITAGGISKNVAFIQDSADSKESVDKAYLAKYSGYGESIVGSTVTHQACAATLKILPR